MTSSSTGRGKPDTRRTLLSRRDALTDRERAAKSVAICERAVAYLGGRCEPGSVVALYAHTGSEVQTERLDTQLRARGFRVAYPRVVDTHRELAFAEVAITDLVASGHWGLREPIGPATQLADIRAFVMPGLAFDRDGGRVGWGKGHYDATLAAADRKGLGAMRAPALRIGLAFDCQVIERVPREPHDAVLDALITETTTHVVVRG